MPSEELYGTHVTQFLPVGPRGVQDLLEGTTSQSQVRVGRAWARGRVSCGEGGF